MDAHFDSFKGLGRKCQRNRKVWRFDIGRGDSFKISAMVCGMRYNIVYN